MMFHLVWILLPLSMASRQHTPGTSCLPLGVDIPGKLAHIGGALSHVMASLRSRQRLDGLGR
jgi:hypothetical protein